jgi:hypothetical protein
MQISVLRIYRAAEKGRRTARPQPSDLCLSTLLFALGPEALKLFVAREPLERSMSACSQCWRLKASRLIQGIVACALNNPFPGVSTNKPSGKYRRSFGLCLTVFSKRRGVASAKYRQKRRHSTVNEAAHSWKAVYSGSSWQRRIERRNGGLALFLDGPGRRPPVKRIRQPFQNGVPPGAHASAPAVARAEAAMG